MRALAKEPSERFATAEEFIQALPDLHGVPYIAAPTIDDDATRLPSSVPKVARAQPPATVSPDQTLLQPDSPKTADAQRPETISPDQTLLQPDAPRAADAKHLEPASPDTMLPRQEAPKAAHARRAGTAIAIGGLLVLSIVCIVLYSARQADLGTEPPDTAANTPATVDPKPTEQVTPAPSPTLESSHDLTGMWSGTYVDRSGTARLQLLNLQMQQVPDGAITGRFTYKTGISAGEDCTLDKSSYSKKSKRLRLITHCHNPDHPKYLNVPLEFLDVDPGATTIEGGRLAFHLADDIVVTLRRTNGI
jgi:hypothetical protein